MYKEKQRLSERELSPSEQQDFCDYVKEVTGKEIKNHTSEKIGRLYEDFLLGKLSSDLQRKVEKEYIQFIEEMKKQPADYIIEAAYEIVWKDNIEEFIENEPPILSKEQYKALLSPKNTLEELYVGWLSNGEWHTYDDIAQLLENVAEDMLAVLEREEKN